MMAILVLIAVLFAGGGFPMSSSATAGVYLSSVGCLFAVLARMVQAESQHRELLARLDLRAAAASARTQELAVSAPPA